MRTLRVSPLVVVLTGCAGGSSPAAPAAPVGSVAPATSQAAVPATHKADDAPPKRDDAAKPAAIRWVGYAGPKAETTIDTKRAWALVPVAPGGDFGAVRVALLEYVRTDGDEHVLRRANEEIFVPRAMVRATGPAKGLKAGSSIIASVDGASSFGRVTAIVKGDDGERVKFQSVGASSVSDGELPIDQVIPVEDKLQYGQPVAYEDKGEHFATVVHTGEVWVHVVDDAGRLRSVGARFVRPLKVTKVFKRGDRVSAPGDHQILSGTVTEVLDGGLRYKVKVGANERIHPFQHVGAP